MTLAFSDNATIPMPSTLVIPTYVGPATSPFSFMLDQCIVIDDDQLWWFHMVDECIFSLSDKPENTISRIGGGKIQVSDEIANDLHSYFELIKNNYCNIINIDYFNSVSCILDKMNRVTNWSNDDFINDEKWLEIRIMARRAYLQRIGLTSR